LKAEQDSILQFYEPYFVIDEEVQKNALAEFDADLNLNEKLSALPPNYKVYLREKLNELYTNGIMRSVDYDRIRDSATGSLRIKEGNVARARKIETFYTIRSAYEEVLSGAPEGIDVALLRSPISTNIFVKM